MRPRALANRVGAVAGRRRARAGGRALRALAVDEEPARPRRAARPPAMPGADRKTRAGAEGSRSSGAWASSVPGGPCRQTTRIATPHGQDSLEPGGRPCRRVQGLRGRRLDPSGRDVRPPERPHDPEHDPGAARRRRVWRAMPACWTWAAGRGTCPRRRPRAARWSPVRTSPRACWPWPGAAIRRSRSCARMPRRCRSRSAPSTPWWATSCSTTCRGPRSQPQRSPACSRRAAALRSRPGSAPTACASSRSSATPRAAPG